MSSFLDRSFQIIYWILYRLMRGLWFFTRPAVYGVYVCIWHGERLLIIRNSYKQDYTVPCGNIGRHETALAAAVREVAEEVGIDLAPETLRRVGKRTLFHEYKHDTVTFFDVRLAERPVVRVDQREVVWAAFLSVSEIRDLPLSHFVTEYLSGRVAP